MSRKLTSASSLDTLKKEAKRWLKALSANDQQARERLIRAYPKAPNVPGLRDVQHAIALEHGLAGWTALKLQCSASAAPSRPTLELYEEMAEALLEAYSTGTPAAMERHWKHTWHRRNWKAMRTYVQLDLGKRSESPEQDVEISLSDAQLHVALEHGFKCWQALTEFVASLPVTRSTIASKPVTLWSINEDGSKKPIARERDWDLVIGMMREKQIPALNAEGQMTDAVLDRVSRLTHVTSLELNSSHQLTDQGLRYLARMPQLQHLGLTGTSITDDGLQVLRDLPELRSLQMCWQGGISDVGVASLSFCSQIESVDLMGTPTGDGAIKALAGKNKLRRLKTGRLVTDAGLELLHEIPAFKTWQGGDAKYSLTSADAGPNHLLLDGTFTNQGFASLAALDGLFGVSLFWHVSQLTPDGLKALISLPNLGFLGCEGKLCNDVAIRHIASMPKLRMLMAQGTVASDAGFAELSRSQTIEYIWGRECPNLSGPGFAAMARMPVLRGLAVSCKYVDDAGLSALPRFPALREIMPMDVPDDGYRHVGQCEHLESLVLMYCRETTDLATEHISGLSNLKKYFASYTKITDRSMEILSRMPSLERISFYGCPGVTNAGVAMLAGMPRLREVEISGQQLTRECVTAFPAGVHVEFSDV